MKCTSSCASWNKDLPAPETMSLFMKETFRETGLGMLGWDMKMEDGLVGLYDWIRYWCLRYWVGYMSQNKETSAARVPENCSNACNVMSFVHESVFTLVFIKKSLSFSILTLRFTCEVACHECFFGKPLNDMGTLRITTTRSTSSYFP